MNAKVKPDEALWRLLIADEVDKFMNTLVPEVQKVIEGLFKARHSMERHQLSNLVSATLETDSAEVVRAYVQYQIGRDNPRRPRNWGAGEPPFGEQVLKWIAELQRQARGLVESTARGGIGPINKQAEAERVWMVLVRRFAGHLERAFVYRDALQKQKRGGQR